MAATEALRLGLLIAVAFANDATPIEQSFLARTEQRFIRAQQSFGEQFDVNLRAAALTIRRGQRSASSGFGALVWRQRIVRPGLAGAVQARIFGASHARNGPPLSPLVSAVFTSWIGR